MAIVVGIPPNAEGWQYNLNASAAQTNVEAKAAATGKRMFITHIFFNGAGAQTLQLLDASAGTVVFGVVTLAEDTPLVVDRSAMPLEVGQSKGVFVTTVGGGVQTLNLAGFVI
jgi:hypothetical protein